ncbi:hypothetical protein MNBD_NITROSPINAE01-1095 [hydrothermal vent metagenome]|uniref:Histidine kinase domain-containing protein n=1 Tax=hydrothermal vent metagenome TaxID=652676 RepID=A0A3B1CJZ2_9ZZZZ
MVYTYFSLLPLSSIALCLALGAFTFSRNPRNPVNIGFALGMASIALIETGNAITLFSLSSSGTVAPGMKLSTIGEALMPVVWYVFSVTFTRVNPKEALQGKLPFFVGLTLVALFFIALIGSPDFLSAPNFNSVSPFFTIGTFGKYFYVYLIVGIVLNLGSLENTLRSSSGIQRWQIKYIIFGVGAILILFIYKATQALLFSAINIQLLPVISVVIIISTSIMALFIVRHRLLDVDVFVSRYVVYNSVTVLIVGAYLLSVGVIVQGAKYLNIPFNYFFSALFIFISALALLVLLFTASLRRKVQLFINRNFYRHKYEFRDKWMESIKRISSQRSVDDIQKTLIEMISETMGAKSVRLWLYDSASKSYLPVNQMSDASNNRMGKDAPLLFYIKQNMAPFLLKDVDEGASGEMKTLMKKTETVLCAPLLAGSEVVGFVLQGKDISGEQYKQDDFELLTALTTQTAVQIKNTRLAQDLMAVKQIDAFAKMSSFVMHDLKNLTNMLSLVSQNAKGNMDNPEFQKDAMNTVEGTVARMKKLIEKLSTVQGGFEFELESVNLVSLIGNSADKAIMGYESSIKIFQGIDKSLEVYVDREAIEMVLLNIIKNSCEAICGDGAIDIKASMYGQNVEIIVSDTGCGMSEEFIEKSLFTPFKSTKDYGFGIGLYQCKSIVESHGGKIDVTSKKNEGTTFIVSLPASGARKSRA